MILYIVFLVKNVTSISKAEDWSFLPWFLFFVLMTILLSYIIYNFIYYTTFRGLYFVVPWSHGVYTILIYIGKCIRKWGYIAYMSVCVAVCFLRKWVLLWFHNIIKFGWGDSFRFFGGVIGLKLFIYVGFFIFLVEIFAYFWDKDDEYWETWPWGKRKRRK